jgi:signal transduction histidine kinase/ActR/RegA family two-component response regulator
MKPPETDGLQHGVLILAPAGRDGTLAGRVLAESGVRSKVMSSLDELCVGIREGPGAVLLTEEVLRPESIEKLAAVLASQPPWSDLAVLVFSSLGNVPETEAIWRRQLRTLANVIFLDRPTRRVALVSAVLAALGARRRQYEVRDLLSELERAVRGRDQFLAMLGHELRNPLGAIVASVQLMERKHPGVAVAERRVIHRQADLLSRLVDDLLDVSRVTSGKIALERRTVDLGDLLARCVSSHAAAAKEVNVALALSAEAAVCVKGDPVRLEQVVHNLLTNAVKYTPSGGRVDVGLARRGDEAELSVADTGVGMGAEILPRVFDLFTQADETLDRAHGGLGIGLTLVRSLVDLHGGSVRAESAGRGRGSTFVVRLPTAAARPRERPHRAPAAVAARSILLVEDNADVRESLKSLLEEFGHHVIAAADGIEGITRGIASRPDVALVDIGLPGLDGYGVARRLREKLGDSVYLVAVTGYGLPEDRRLALEGGFDAHMTKPLVLRAVLQLISRSKEVQAEKLKAAQG